MKHTCDCDKDVVLSYAAMRWDLKKEIETFNFPSREIMVEELQAKNLGYDFSINKHTITMKTNINKLKQYYIADKLGKNLGDISKVEKLPYADMVTYSFCCQDLSCAGKGEGMKLNCDKCGHSWLVDFEHPENNNTCPICSNIDIASTRSGLLNQVQRLLGVAKTENTLPKYLLLENVKNLIGKKFIGQFEAWVKWLDSVGYNTYYKVLNAKHYGIAQNRERVFAISIRKDVDNGYTFPEQIPLTLRLKDMLEQNVDEKYYLPDERIEKILNSTFVQEKKRIQTTDICDTLLARDWKDPKCVPVEDSYDIKERFFRQVAETISENKCEPGDIIDAFNKKVNKTGVSPTITTRPEGFKTAILPVVEKHLVVNYIKPQIVQNPHGFNKGSVQEDCPAITSSCFQENNFVVEPIVYDDYNSRISADQDAINTLTCNCGASAERNGVKIIEPVVVDAIYNNRPARIYDKTAPTLRSERFGLEVIEPKDLPCSTRGKQIASTIRASIYKQGARNLEQNVINGLGYEGVIENGEPRIRWRIRKLTPKECLRLMGFTDQDADRSAQFVSASAQYKQAGNSICTSCLIALFSSLLLEDGHKADIWSKYLINYSEKKLKSTSNHLTQQNDCDIV